MVAIGIQTISKELMLACRQLGHVVSEALAALVASTVINANLGSFYVERPIDEADARVVVEDAAKRILSRDEPGISCLRLQAAYELAFADIEREAQRDRAKAKDAEERIVGWISNFTAKFDQDFDTLADLYKRIYKFLMLRCTGPTAVALPPKATGVEREVAAALESVFPRVGLRSFVALTGPEKAAQLQELAGIILGIRIFNQHQNKGGAGLPTVDGAVEKLNAAAILDQVSAEVEELNERCKSYTDMLLVARNTTQTSQWDEIPTTHDVERARSDLLYHRQYLCFMLNLQEDLASSIERLRMDHRQLKEELVDLDALVGGRVSVPKEHVYPRFDGIARGYRNAFTEIQALEARVKLHGVLGELKAAYFPRLPEVAAKLLAGLARQNALPSLETDDVGEVVNLDALAGPAPGGLDVPGGPAVRLTVENAPDFLTLPLDFQGFCLHTLVTQNRLLVPGNPSHGVIRYAGRYCVFATERGCFDFCEEPDKYFSSVRDVCYRHPELIHLLRLNEDFPKSSLHAIVQLAAGSPAAMQADVGVETPLHFQDSHIDKDYEWNEWRLRKEALHMADIRGKTTSATQTALSHLRREGETQVYLPKEVATNTAVDRGTNPPRWRTYSVGLRGEPQAMKLSKVNFDL